MADSQAANPQDDTFDPGALAPQSPEAVAPVPEPQPAIQTRMPESGQFGHKHPAYLVQAAQKLGFEDSDIAATPTEQLGSLVTRMQGQMLSFREQQATARTVADNQVRTPEPDPEFDIGMDVSAFDPDFIKVVKKVGGQADKRIKQLESKLAEYEQREQQRSQSEQDRQIDSIFAGLGDFKDIFGDGSIQDLTEGSAERERRLAVVALAMRSKEGSLSARIAKQANILFPRAAKPGVPAGKEPPSQYLPTNGKAITPEQWAQGGTAPPTQRATTTDELPNGDKKAVRNLEKRFRDSGVRVSDAEELEGFLG